MKVHYDILSTFLHCFQGLQINIIFKGPQTWAYKKWTYQTKKKIWVHLIFFLMAAFITHWII